MNKGLTVRGAQMHGQRYIPIGRTPDHRLAS
jgi:hypothetical protein